MTETHLELIAKLNSKTAKIGIVGLGYAGLPLMLRYCEVGYKVIGFDVDQLKVDSLRAGRSYIEHIESERLSNCVDRHGLEPTSDLSRIAEVDAHIPCVRTPLSKHHRRALSIVLSMVDFALLFFHP